MANINGDGGNNNLFGTVNADVLNGLGGNDTLTAFGGADAVNGGVGDDILVGGAGNDTLDGGAGYDQVLYYRETGSGGVRVDLAAGTATDTFGTTDRLVSIERVYGSEANDTLLGTGARDFLFGRDGDDLIDGRDGDNLIFTGGGNDTIRVGTTTFDARDTVVVDGGGTKVITGFDSLGTQFGHHIVFRVDGPVNVNLATGIATSNGMRTDFSQALFFLEVNGSASNDAIVGGNPRHNELEWFVGFQGNDTIDGGTGTGDTIVYDDEVLIGQFNYVTGVQEFGTRGVTVNLQTGTATDSYGDTDRLINIDQVRATRFVDIIIGSAEDNGFWSLAGADTVDGGAGIDRIHYDEDYLTGGTAGVIVDLAAGTGIDGFGDTDRLINIEGVFGTRTGDRVSGNAVGNRFDGLAGDDTLNGLGGDDTILGGDGNDSLDGGINHDELWGQAGNDTIDGGAGSDLVRYREDPQGVTVNLSTGQARDGFDGTDTLRNIEQVHGSDFADDLTGNGDANRIFGFAGNDSLNGMGGNDVILGGDGDDSITGGNGDDELWGELGTDTLDGGEGSDVVRYRNATEAITADLTAGFARDGMGAVDVLRNIENIHGSDFGDDLTGSAGGNQIFGYEGNDTIRGGGGGDTLSGGAGGDTYIFQPGDGYQIVNDLGAATGGDDTLILNGYAAANARVYRQNPNTETVVIDFGVSGDVVVLANTLSASNPGAVERVIFGDGETWDHATLIARFAQEAVPASLSPTAENDVLTGNGDANRIFGFAGNDAITGRGGNDALSGGDGADTLSGGDGSDTLNGGDGDDSITGGDTAADLRDVVFGRNGNDSIDGGYGNDELRGDAGNDTIEGGFGADTVIGGTGDDVLSGQAFGDIIFGGDGFDFINGGFGSDRVNGGAGGDRFYHLGIADHGSDWIQDYNAAQGDVLVYGGTATVSQFQLNFATTPTAGVDDVQEAFVIFRPTEQILWALIDGAGQEQINLSIGGEVFDLMA